MGEIGQFTPALRTWEWLAMRVTESAARSRRAGRAGWWLGALLAAGMAGAAGAGDAARDEQGACCDGGACDACAAPAVSKEKVALGRQIFLREWMPGDARSHGGDGLGPVFNDSSCVACHNAGAPGGG